MAAYYNEHDAYAAQWLRNLITKGLIANGEVDTRSIVDVHPDELRGFTQAHFFAGIGGWSHALRLAGWPDDRCVWTGSCPCQPFSVAGKGLGADDPRHLWPHFFRLIRSARPSVVMGEQVAGAAGYGWFDGVAADLEGEGYASRAVDVPACAVDAPHIRSRLYWVASDVADAAHGGWREERADGGRRAAGDRAQGRAAGFDAGRLDDADDARLEGHAGHGCDGAGWPRAAGPATATGGGDMADANVADEINGRVQRGCEQRRPSGDPQSCAGGNGTFWSDHIWLTGADGKARRARANISMLVDGLPNYLGRLRSEDYAKAIKEVREHGTAFEGDPGAALRAVWQAVLQGQASIGPLAERAGVQATEILLAYLRELDRRIDGSGEIGASQEASQSDVRSVRPYGETAFASCGRGPREQLAREHSNAVRSLSWVLAQYAGEAWAAHWRENAAPYPLLTHGEPARVGRLRAFGNAIVPQLAAEVVAAFMDCEP
jgi:DNA (cytosine-5)-methyltransferase 1